MWQLIQIQKYERKKATKKLINLLHTNYVNNKNQFHLPFLDEVFGTGSDFDNGLLFD